MDIQKEFDNAKIIARQERLNRTNQLTLGELILKLEPITEKQEEIIKKYKHEATIVYDFEYLFPTNLNSWRGSYEELALNFQSEGEELTVTKFLKLLKNTIGKTFYGYKGGDFIMNRHTPLWVANYGHSGSTAIVDILDKEYQIILITAYIEF